MENKITVVNICSMYSEITVEKECKCKYNVNLLLNRDIVTCGLCNNSMKIITKHIVPNNGWLPLKYWVAKFQKEE